MKKTLWGERGRNTAQIDGPRQSLLGEREGGLKDTCARKGSETWQKVRLMLGPLCEYTGGAVE